MTDRELLELAAKASGEDNYEYVGNEYRDGRKVNGHYCSLLEVCINPLTNDADALRLAVWLGLSIRMDTDAKRVDVISKFGEVAITGYFVDCGNDPFATTRRAIVHAAAEIGRGMK